MKWLDRISHLDIALLNCFAGIILSISILFGNKQWWFFVLLFANIVSIIANLFYSWKDDEFNRRKYRKGKGVIE